MLLRVLFFFRNHISDFVLKRFKGLFFENEFGLSKVLDRIVLLHVVLHKFGVSTHEIVIEFSDASQCHKVEHKVEDGVVELQIQNIEELDNHHDRELEDAAHRSLAWVLELVIVVGCVLKALHSLLEFRHENKVRQKGEYESHQLQRPVHKQLFFVLKVPEEHYADKCLRAKAEVHLTEDAFLLRIHGQVFSLYI